MDGIFGCVSVSGVYVQTLRYRRLIGASGVGSFNGVAWKQLGFDRIGLLLDPVKNRNTDGVNGREVIARKLG